MGILRISVVLLLVASLTGTAQEDPKVTEDEISVRFAPLHIWIDPAGQPLAAYQFELKTVRGQIRIVGVEGGEHPAYAAAPFYDPAALEQDRIIIAAYNTGEKLPIEGFRVSTVHLQILGDENPEYEIQLKAASNRDGEDISATITCQKGESL